MTSVMQERPSPNQSSESESRQSRTPSASEPTASGNNGKKRASRAGTRSVTTLSAAQLERKRANDREAQRAIRQRTKEHIEKLERRIVELSSGSESNEQLLAALKRNKELEEENAVLRANLDNFAMGVSESPGGGFEDVPNIKVPDLRMVNHPPAQHSAQVRRSESSAFAQPPQWQSTNPFGSPATSRAPSSALSTNSGSTDSSTQWRYGRGRPSTGSTDEYMKTSAPTMPQPMQYPHMMGETNQGNVSRGSSQPGMYSGMTEGHDSQARHYGEQIPSGSMSSQYRSSQDQRMYMTQQQPQMQQQSQHQGQVQMNPSSASQSQHHQRMYYGPYSR